MRQAGQSMAAWEEEEDASGAAMEEGLRNDAVCESQQRKNSLRADAAGQFTFSYIPKGLDLKSFTTLTKIRVEREDARLTSGT